MLWLPVGRSRREDLERSPYPQLRTGWKNRRGRGTGGDGGREKYRLGKGNEISKKWRDRGGGKEGGKGGGKSVPVC